MRLPITDEFLWTLYNFSEKAGDIMDFLHLRAPKITDVSWVGFQEVKRVLENRKAKANFRQIVYYLKKNGYIKVKNLEGKKAILLEKAGLEKLLRAKFRTLKKRKRKDGKWIMLIFDIPERKRFLRELLRGMLHQSGYKMFQRSVWVCPYDVQKETEDFLQRNSLDKYVKLFLIEEIS